MDFLRAIRIVLTLFVATCIFCWVFTSYWMFGPVITIAFFLGSILLISLLGVVLLEQQ